MVYRFADDLIRCVHNEDASPLRSYSDSSSLSSTCMPTRVFITILCSAVSRILKTMNLLQILTKSSRLLWPPTSSQRQLGGQLFSSHVVMIKNFDEKAGNFSEKAVMTMIVFCTCCFNCSQCTNHGCKLLRTTFQMCLIHWAHRHSIAVVVFDSNDLNWLSLEVPLWFIGRVIYYHYYYYVPNYWEYEGTTVSERNKW